MTEKHIEKLILTGQNHANIRHDLEELASRYAAQGRRDRDIKIFAQMLVRSFDPCIFCSEH